MDVKIAGQHVSQVVAPLLAAFTLPTIAVIVVTPPPHWRYVILSLFVVSTGLLLAGFQLSVGRLFHDAAPWNEIRAILTFLGLIALAAGLALLAASSREADRGALYAALAILAAGVLAPICLNLWLWLADRLRARPVVNVEQRVRRALQDPEISEIRLAGSRAARQAGPLSDWDFEVSARCFPAVMSRMPDLVAPLHPLAAQWDRLSARWCYMLILPGPVKVDLLFGQHRAISPPWTVTAGTLPRIDDHFWDWMLWLFSKQRPGSDDVLPAELGNLYQHLLRPLGVTAAPVTLDQAISDYRAARGDREDELGVRVPRTTEHAIMQALYPRHVHRDREKPPPRVDGSPVSEQAQRSCGSPEPVAPPRQE